MSPVFSASQVLLGLRTKIYAAMVLIMTSILIWRERICSARVEIARGK